MFGVSLSRLVTLTLGVVGPGMLVAVTEMVYTTFPSATKSFTPVTRTGIVGLVPIVTFTWNPPGISVAPGYDVLTTPSAVLLLMHWRTESAGDGWLYLMSKFVV